MIRQNSLLCAGCASRRCLLLMYVSTALLSMPVRLALLANGHGPLGRLPVGFRAKSAIFLASTQKSYFPGFSRHQPSACPLLRRSKGGFATFCLFRDLLGNKGFLDAAALTRQIAQLAARPQMRYKNIFARVAELVDALDLESSTLGMGVQIPPLAPSIISVSCDCASPFFCVKSCTKSAPNYFDSDSVSRLGMSAAARA